MTLEKVICKGHQNQFMWGVEIYVFDPAEPKSGVKLQKM
jgi:hypothetical protein